MTAIEDPAIEAAREAVRKSLDCACWDKDSDICDYDDAGEPCGCRQAAWAAVAAADAVRNAR